LGVLRVVIQQGPFLRPQCHPSLGLGLALAKPLPPYTGAYRGPIVWKGRGGGIWLQN
jgi:hypothetical protein